MTKIFQIYTNFFAVAQFFIKSIQGVDSQEMDIEKEF